MGSRIEKKGISCISSESSDFFAALAMPKRHQACCWGLTIPSGSCRQKPKLKNLSHRIDVVVIAKRLNIEDGRRCDRFLGGTHRSVACENAAAARQRSELG